MVQQGKQALADLTNVVLRGADGPVGKAAAAAAAAGKRKRSSTGGGERAAAPERAAKAPRCAPASRSNGNGTAGSRKRPAQEVISISSDRSDLVDLADGEREVESPVSRAPYEPTVLPTHRGYPFCADGGRRLTEQKFPTGTYVGQGLLLFSSYMRQVLVDWIFSAHRGMSLDEETLHLAVRYVDAFLTRRGPEAFLTDPRKHQVLQRHPTLTHGHGIIMPGVQPVEPLCNKLKRLGATCLFVASKVAEISSFSAVDFAAAAHVPLFNREQIILAERALLRTLSFDTYLPTACSFTSAYHDALTAEVASRHLYLDPSVVRAAQYYADLSLLSHAALNWQPSLLAAAGLSLALEKYEPTLTWDSTKLPVFSGYTASELAAPRAVLMALARDAQSIYRSTANRFPGGGSSLVVTKRYTVDIIDAAAG